MPCSPATAATETPGVRQVARRVALNSGEYLRWVRRVEYLCLSEVLSIVSTIKFVDTILQDLAANLKMTLLDAYALTTKSAPMWRSIASAKVGSKCRPVKRWTAKANRCCSNSRGGLRCFTVERHFLTFPRHQHIARGGGYAYLAPCIFFVDLSIALQTD